MFYRKKTKLIVTISLVLIITLAYGATAIGIYAALTSQLGTIATPISSQMVCEGGIRLVRGHNGDITKIQYLSQTEAEEILTDLDIAYSSLMKEDEDVSRLLKDKVSEKVLNTINSCDAGTWYVVVEDEYQYIYYNGVPHNYAWQPEISQDSATIQIFDTGKSTSTCTYVLLKVPASLKLDVYYNAAKIKYEKVNIQ